MKRWRMTLSLVAVFIFTNWLYTVTKSQSATIVETYDDNGNPVGFSEFAKGRVVAVADVYEEPDTGNLVYLLEIELLGGRFKGRRALFRNYIHPTGFPTLNINADVGDIVLVRVAGTGEIMSARTIVQDYNRDGFIVALLGFLFAVVIVVGRETGIRAVVTMVINGLLIYYVLLPMVHQGQSPVWAVVLTCALISIQSRLIVAGFGRKTYAAILGTIGGVTISGIVILYTQRYLHFTGLEKANVIELVQSQTAPYLDFAGLLIGGMLIGVLGVANDAAIEVASAMEEVNEANPNLTIPQLMVSGMNVGTDILGTMTNTIVFVYFGMRLLVVLGVLGTDIIPVTTMELFSLGVIASELVRIIAGTFGLVLTIPLTAAISGAFHWYARRRALARAVVA